VNEWVSEVLQKWDSRNNMFLLKIFEYRWQMCKVLESVRWTLPLWNSLVLYEIASTNLFH